jgi:hypothetical protein
VPAADPADASIKRDIAAVRRKYQVPDGWSPARWAATYTKQAARAARSLLPRLKVNQLEEGDVVVPMTDGTSLCLSLLQWGTVNGIATRKGRTYVASVTDGAARAMFELSAAIWTAPQFRPDIGQLKAAQTLQLPAFAIPRGLEHVAAVARLGRDANGARQMSRRTPAWLNIGLATLGEARRYAFERTFSEGIRFLFAHEMAHVCYGHLDIRSAGCRFDSFSELRHRFARETDAAGGNVALPPEFLRALEIQADRDALRRLLHAAIGRDRHLSRRNGEGHAANHEVVLSVLGVALVLLMFHAQRVFGKRQDEAVKHPPLWFRADEVLRAEARAYAASRLRTKASVRFLAQTTLVRTLAAVSELHPLFGDWLAPSTGRDRESSAESVLVQARAAVNRWPGGLPRTVRLPVGFPVLQQPSLTTPARSRRDP